jgi:hypothetical protein
LNYTPANQRKVKLYAGQSEASFCRDISGSLASLHSGLSKSLQGSSSLLMAFLDRKVYTLRYKSCFLLCRLQILHLPLLLNQSFFRILIHNFFKSDSDTDSNSATNSNGRLSLVSYVLYICTNTVNLKNEKSIETGYIWHFSLNFFHDRN